ncbi:MAG: hypothetical protein JWL76_1466 [Thermoleophilia bacterium]|nr:hypothetical protein [Thermoleophilia bacterium]
MGTAASTSYEALCAYGRVFSAHILLVPPTEVFDVRRRFGTPPQPCRGSRARFHRDDTGSDYLKFFIASDVIDAHDESSERVVAYADMDEASVYVASGTGPPTGATPVAWKPIPDAVGVPNAHNAKWQEGTTQQNHAMSVIEPHAAHWWGEELHAHEAVGTSYFVTVDADLLSERVASNLLLDRGIVSPAEMVRIVELEMLRRGKVHIGLGNGFRDTIDADTSYYSGLAMAIVPQLVRLLRSSWNPDSRSESVAQHCHQILNRLVHLLRARDELTRIHLEEGWDRAGNGIRDRQGYHTQYAVILASSLLDSLVLIAADLSGDTVDPRDVSWRDAILRAPSRKGWIKKLDSGSTAHRLLQVAQSSEFVPASRVLHELRDQVAHRGALDTANLEWRPSGYASDTLRKGALIASAAELDAEQIPGGYRYQGPLTLIPHSFVDGLVRGVAACVEEVVSVLPTPDSDWWRADERMAQASWDDEYTVAALKHLSGWGGSTPAIP